MITNSFIFLERVGSQLEKNLWKQGINDWDSFLRRQSIKGLSFARKKYFERKILEARRELYRFNSNYFAKILPSTEHWRLYDFFKDDTVFLDIETTGLSKYDRVTVIGLYDGINTKTMIDGINFDLKTLNNELKKYKLIVTFNGASFDLPFIKKRFPYLLPDVPHLDLRHVCSRIGLTGGLKNIEKEMGIKRRNLVERMHGGDAVTLWKMYKATGDDHYLNLLVEYNEEDIINLKKIADFVVGKMKEKLSILS